MTFEPIRLIFNSWIYQLLNLKFEPPHFMLAFIMGNFFEFHLNINCSTYKTFCFFLLRFLILLNFFIISWNLLLLLILFAPVDSHFVYLTIFVFLYVLIVNF